MEEIRVKYKNLLDGRNWIKIQEFVRWKKLE